VRGRLVEMSPATATAAATITVHPARGPRVAFQVDGKTRVEVVVNGRHFVSWLQAGHKGQQVAVFSTAKRAHVAHKVEVVSNTLPPQVMMGIILGVGYDPRKGAGTVTLRGPGGRPVSFALHRGTAFEQVVNGHARPGSVLPQHKGQVGAVIYQKAARPGQMATAARVTVFLNPPLNTRKPPPPKKKKK
jgi:hypothetical protein